MICRLGCVPRAGLRGWCHSMPSIQRGQERALDPLELELSAVMWVLCTRSRFILLTSESSVQDLERSYTRVCQMLNRYSVLCYILKRTRDFLREPVPGVVAVYPFLLVSIHFFFSMSSAAYLYLPGASGTSEFLFPSPNPVLHTRT